jgi:uncharacterized protein
MLKKLLLLILATALAAVGVIGLVLPFVPGVLFLAAAAGCMSMVDPRLQQALGRRLGRNPRYRYLRARWQAGRLLPRSQRARLTVLLLLRSLLPRT